MRKVSPFLLLAVLLAGSAAQLAWAGAAPAASSQRITTNFRDTDIATVAEAVANATGRTFIVDPRVRAQVNLISTTPMTANEFYQAFLSILQVHGFAAVPTGNIVKIVPDANVRTVPGNDLQSSINSGSDEIVTQVITARNINAAQLAQVLRPLIAQYGNIAPVPGTNTLIITDRASNVSRIMRIVNRVDQAGDANIEVIPLQNSTATDVVRTLTALTSGQAAGPEAAAGGAPRVVADERSNSILVSGDSAQRLRIATLIAHLDTPMESGGGTEVVYLRFANAEKLAPKLKEQMTGVATAGPGAAGAAATGTPADRNVNIWPEPETNALVITAPPKTLRAIRAIIDRIDIRRAQVQVEALIVDVSTAQSADLGVNWAIYSGSDGEQLPAGVFNTPVGGTSIVDLATIVRDPEAALAAGAAVPQGATFALGRLSETGISFAAMIRAMRADANTNIIATPTVTTMDNQEAELKNAQEVPFITGQYTTPTGAGGQQGPTPFTTVEREEVGLILKVTPQITNEGDTIVMKIDLESSELSGEAGDAGSLITLKRTVKTNVLIEDGGTIVIGGLIRDADINGEQRVPWLGRIPLIGEAFRTRSGRRAQTNLMVFIRPKILADGLQTAIESNAKYNAVREVQKKMGSRVELIPLLPGNGPELPPAPPLPLAVAPAAAAPGDGTTPPAGPVTTSPVADPAQPAPAPVPPAPQ